MIARRSLTYILILVALGGCGESLKSAWGDFTAYYNTYYDAQKYLDQGVKKVEAIQQPVDLDHPVRIFPTPPNADPSDFQVALEKGTKVIREHPHSHWADNALLLVGKAYFYQAHYYDAEQVLDNLYEVTESEELRQKAVFWLGRIYLETGRFDDGMTYLHDRLVSDSLHWQPVYRNRVELLRADLGVMSGDYRQARIYLREVTPHLDERNMKARAAYLDGQLAEQEREYREAYRLFSLSFLTRPDFELMFAARFKMGVTAREMGQPALSLSIFNAMLKDDKNIDRLPLINLAKATTLEDMGQYDRARLELEGVLHDTWAKSPPALKVRAYYKIGEMYRGHYKDYLMAKAYYDSAARERIEASDLPPTIDISGRRKTFAAYAALRLDIGKIDSLLWLGSMPETEADSILKVSAERHREEMLAERNKGQNTLVNVQAINTQVQSSNAGFLNILNPYLEREAKSAFKAIWGNRPLVDNWRRAAAITGSRQPMLSQKSQPQQETATNNQITTSISPDLAGIPFSESQKIKMRRERLNKLYELANVFFLQMNTPDSAEYYYRKIINQRLDSALVPKAIYSLIQLYREEGQTSLEQQWEDTLTSKYSGSVYTARLVHPDDKHLISPNRANDSLERGFAHLVTVYKDSSLFSSAEAARNWASEHDSSEVAAEALYYSAEQYIKAAQTDTTGRCSDSASVHQGGAAYQGPCWDQARSLLQRLVGRYPGWQGRQKASLLLQAIERKKNN